MFESYSAYGAYQVAEARLTELSTIAEKQQHGAEQPARPARWSRRILANVGTRLIALGQHLAY